MKIFKKRSFDTKSSISTQVERTQKKPFVVSAYKVRVSNHLFFISFLLTTLQSICSPGCMDNSWHLARPFDSKEYHIVTREVGKNKTYCPCPCRKLSLSRGQCLECGHKHDIQPWIIVRKENRQ